MTAWCESNFEQIMDLLGDEENESEYNLRPSDAQDLQTFLLGKNFHAILASLDADHDRVAKRQERREAVDVFKAYRRDMGTRELSRWVDSTKEYDQDDYEDMKSPPIPVPYDTWQEVDHYASTTHPDDVTNPSGPLFSEVIRSMLAYVHSLHYKIDYIMKHNKSLQSAGHASERANLQIRHPFLLACDAHVWEVPNTTPKMLARTPPVQPFTLRILTCLFLPART